MLYTIHRPYYFDPKQTNTKLQLRNTRAFQDSISYFPIDNGKPPASNVYKDKCNCGESLTIHLTEDNTN